MNRLHDRRLRHWYICFCEGNHEYPLRRFFKKGFRHVWAFAYDEPADIWLVFDPGLDGILIRATKKASKIMARAYVEGPVLRIEIENQMLIRSRFFTTCVSQVCQLLGMNLFVHTPWRLFCALKHRGAESVLLKDW